MSGTRLDGPRPAVPGPAGVGRSGVAVDPRFRARRIAVRKEAGRKRLKRLLVLVAVAVLALAAVLVLRSPVLDVDEVVIGGAERTAAEAIQRAIDIDAGDPILLADLGGAAAAIEQLPWVAEAEVDRDLPGTVRIAVHERTATAVVAGGGQAVLVDADGRVLDRAGAAARTRHVQVVVEHAPPEPGATVPTELSTAIELAARLRANPAGAVAAVRLEPDLHLELADGGVVQLGDASQLDAKVEAFRTVHARVERACLDVVDLTVPTHPVLTRDPGC